MGEGLGGGGGNGMDRFGHIYILTIGGGVSIVGSVRFQESDPLRHAASIFPRLGLAFPLRPRQSRHRALPRPLEPLERRPAAQIPDQIPERHVPRHRDL